MTYKKGPYKLTLTDADGAIVESWEIINDATAPDTTEIYAEIEDVEKYNRLFKKLER